jgi:hypothetical protein
LRVNALGGTGVLNDTRAHPASGAVTASLRDQDVLAGALSAGIEAVKLTVSDLQKNDARNFRIENWLEKVKNPLDHSTKMPSR